MYEYIVVGGGISGLYFALKHGGNVLVLEKDHVLGGRAISIPFGDQNVNIMPGAGIGIAAKDHILIKLMVDLGYNYSTFWSDKNSDECLDMLKLLYDNMNNITIDMTFMDYLSITLTEYQLDVFRKENGYTDHYTANALTTMLYYGLEDNCSRYLGISILWSKLIEAMSDKCDYKTNCEVLSIQGKYPHFRIITNNGTYSTKNVVIATTISSVRKLLNDPIYDIISSHPFMRVYASFNEQNTKIMREYFPKTIKTQNELHFVIPMSGNVWMIAYTDGEDANLLHRKISKQLMEKYLYKTSKHKIEIQDMKVFYWKEGTHYYLPGKIDFDLIRNPEEGIYVVGEAVAKRQGWCNGALESVDEIL